MSRLPQFVLLQFLLTATAVAQSLLCPDAVRVEPAETKSPIVSLRMDCPAATAIKVSNVNLEDWGTVPEEPYTSVKPWVLAAGLNGPRSVYVKFKDQSGVWTLFSSPPVSIRVDNHSVPRASMLINNGDLFTNDRSVTLSFDSEHSDISVEQVKWLSISDDGTTWGPNFPYQHSVSWSLSRDDGTKTLYVRFLDASFRVLASSQAQISLAAGPAAEREVWIERRASSTPNTAAPIGASPGNPFVVSTASEFDDLMRRLSEPEPSDINPATQQIYSGENVTIHLGPGIFETFGTNGVDRQLLAGKSNSFTDSEGKTYTWRGSLQASAKRVWSLRRGWKIIGAGTEHTTIKLIGADYEGWHANFTIFYGNKTDFIRIAGMTLDGNFSSQGGDRMVSAVEVVGNHGRLSSLRIINFGGGHPTRENFPVATYSNFGNPDSAGDWIYDNVLFAQPEVEWLKNTISFSTGGGGGSYMKRPDGTTEFANFQISNFAVIRNCIYDGTPARAIPIPNDSIVQAGTFGSTNNLVIENNRFLNLRGNVYADTWQHGDFTIRNNHFWRATNPVRLAFMNPNFLLRNFLLFEHNLVEFGIEFNGSGVSAIGVLPGDNDRYSFNDIQIRNNDFRIAEGLPLPSNRYIRIAQIQSSRHTLIEDNLNSIDDDSNNKRLFPNIGWNNILGTLDHQSDILFPSQPPTFLARRNRYGSTSGSLAGRPISVSSPAISRAYSILQTPALAKFKLVDRLPESASLALPSVTEGQELQVEAFSENDPIGALYTKAPAPAGSFDGRVFKWTPPPSSSGNYLVSFVDSSNVGFKNTLITVTSPNPNKRLIDDLRGYWSFEENCTSGGSFLDSSGNQIHSVSTATQAESAQGVKGNAAYFKKLSDRVSISNEGYRLLRRAPHAFTLSFWVNPEMPTSFDPQLKTWKSEWPTYLLMNLGNSFALVLKVISVDSAGTAHARLEFQGMSGIQEFDIPNLGATADITPGRWFHIVVRHDGVSTKIFVDGTSDSPSYSSDKFYKFDNLDPIGLLLTNPGIVKVADEYSAGSTSTTWVFFGKIDELGIWERALSDSEIRLLNSNPGWQTVASPPSAPQSVVIN